MGVIGLDLLATGTAAAAQAVLKTATAGAVAGTGVAVTEAYGIGIQTTFTLTNVSVSTTDHGAAGAQGSLKIYDFPEGLIYVLGAVANCTTARVGTALTTTSAMVWSLGTVAAGAGDATLTTTEADIVPSTVGTLTAGAGTFIAVSTTPALFDGTATAKDLLLNCATVDAGSSGDDAVTVNGTITVTWFYLGDK